MTIRKGLLRLRRLGLSRAKTYLKFFLWLASDTLLFRSPCDAKIFVVSPNSGMRTSVINMTAGDTIMLDAGSFSGPDNCGLEFSTDNTTFQGVPGQTTIVCDGEPAPKRMRGHYTRSTTEANMGAPPRLPGTLHKNGDTFSRRKSPPTPSARLPPQLSIHKKGNIYIFEGGFPPGRLVA